MTRARPTIHRWLLPVVAVIASAAFVVMLASAGSGGLYLASAAAVLETVAYSGPTTAAYLIGALGLGRVVHLLFPQLAPPARFGWSVQFVGGMAVALFLSHLLGTIGHFANRGISSAWLAWLSTLVGFALLILQIRKRSPEPTRWSSAPMASLLLIPAAAVILVAACQPVGTLWASEAHGFDALEYHLELPKEWLSLERVTPVEHNVYSFLPSHMEAAYTQLAAMLPGPPGTPGSGRGWPMYSAQLLHAAMAVLAALLVSRLVRLLVDGEAGAGVAGSIGARLSPEREHRGTGGSVGRGTKIAAGVIGAACFLAIPWTAVTASLPYNEMAVAAMLAGALLVAAMDLSPVARGTVIGLLMGVACSCKPTALFMCAAPVGAVMVLTTAPRRWGGMIGAACGAGLLAMMPWLVRNYLSCGNPVFPFGTSVFGLAHWTAEQAARFHEAHSSGAGLGERLVLLFSPRGLMHGQWSWFAWFVAGAMPLALLSRAVRRPAAILALVIAVQIAMWILIGHHQSRFLLPIAVPGAALIGLAVAALGERAALKPVALPVAAAVVLVLSGESLWNFLRQNQGRPNAFLIGGVGELNGSTLRDALPRLPEAEQQRQLAIRNAEVYVNVMLPTLYPASSPLRVYLLGDSTPFYFEVPVLWNSPWDASPLLRALDESGNDFGGAAEKLRAQGVTHILANLNELDRLRASEYTDPRLTPELVAQFITSQGTMVAAWTADGQNRYLVDITRAPAR
ncbi:MAG TPA: hypothetical protein VG797_02080 [Phycisphaerales bacterium]|nr:hypothetical protein [Phycisphaerales bacterium]